MWRKVLKKEVWDKKWTQSPTVIFSIDLTFFNQATGVVMDTKIVMVKTETGVIFLEVDTKHVVSSFGNEKNWRTQQILFGVGIFLNLV